MNMKINNVRRKVANAKNGIGYIGNFRRVLADSVVN
jgi:hypothetical protein